MENETWGPENCDPFEGSGIGFYRCNLCGTVNGSWDVHKHGGCIKCGHKRISTTNLSFLEKITQVAKHPLIFTRQFGVYFKDLWNALVIYVKAKL